MAAPTVVARTETATTSVATTITVDFTQTTGDLVVFFVAYGEPGSSISGVGDGFRRTGDSQSIGPTTYFKILDGSEGGNAVVTFIDATTKACALAYNIQGWDQGVVPPAAITTIITGTSTTPDPGVVTPLAGSQSYLWIACFRQAGEEADDDAWCNSGPTSFTNLIQKTTGTGGLPSINCSIAAAEFSSTAASMDPGTFDTDQSLGWRAVTLAVYPPGSRILYHSPYPQLLSH